MGRDFGCGFVVRVDMVDVEGEFEEDIVDFVLEATSKTTHSGRFDGFLLIGKVNLANNNFSVCLKD
jgi:hypothetical protein